MYNQFFTIKPRISEKNGGSKVVHLIIIEEESESDIVDSYYESDSNS